MPKKISPVFQKVTNLLNMSIFLAKMRKPLKKVKKFSLLKHYSYGYIQEYQFSPSNTSLIHYYNRKKSFSKQRSYRDICSVFFISRCLGMAKCEGEEKKRRYPVLELERLGSMEEFADFHGGDDDDDDDDDSVDERAEKFIERFYQEIKLQRQESFLEKFNAMVEN